MPHKPGSAVPYKFHVDTLLNAIQLARKLRSTHVDLEEVVVLAASLVLPPRERGNLESALQ